MTRLEYATGAAIVALALTAVTNSLVCDQRAVAKSEQALTEMRAYSLSMLEDRYGTNWNKIQQTMDEMHGPQWTNQLAPEQWATLHELRRGRAENRDWLLR